MLGREPFERAQERPLVRQWFERRRIEKDARARRAAATLQRQRDQVAEPLCRQEVLAWEKPVVACKVELPAARHRGAEQQRAEPASCRRRDRGGKEDPDMTARARPAPLQGRRHPVLSARLEYRERIESPGRTIEVAGEEPAAVVLEQRVDADRLASAQMAFDCLVIQRQVGLRAMPAPASRGRWCIAALAAVRAFPAKRVDIVPAAEEAAYEGDLLARRGRSGAGAWGGFRFARIEDRLRPLRECEQRAQPLVLAAE